MRIAHRFIGGYGEVKQEMSPVRTVEIYAYTLLNRPYGAIPFGYYRPSHEWLGYCRSSLRDFFNSPTVPTFQPIPCDIGTGLPDSLYVGRILQPIVALSYTRIISLLTDGASWT